MEDLWPEGAMTRDETVNLFMTNASKVAAEPVLVEGRDQLNQVLAQILNGGGPVFCPSVSEEERALTIPTEQRTAEYVDATVCVDEVFGAIAETGSIICSSQAGKPVQAGLVATHHIALVPKERVYESLDDFFSQCGDTPPTSIVLETGPSRTADIELTLTIGVHGPARLSIIVF
jgi:L-lactate utilization protein LutC